MFTSVKKTVRANNGSNNSVLTLGDKVVLLLHCIVVLFTAVCSLKLNTDLIIITE